MDTIMDVRAEVLAHRLSLELLWSAVLANNADPLADAEKAHGDSLAVLRGIAARRQGVPAQFTEAMVEHTDSLWKSIEQRLAERRDQNSANTPQ